MISQYELDKVYQYESRGMVTMEELAAVVQGRVTLDDIEREHLWK